MPMSFGERLRQERLRRHLSQEALAEALGISPRSISRWEQNQRFPQGILRLQLCRFFALSPEEFFTDGENQIPLLPLWTVPYPRNRFFTGREELLQRLHELLNQEHTMALTQSLAVSGLGGIGKTQIALEYAYHYRHDYHFVFWTSATTRETLLADMVAIADLLQLPERDEQDQKKVIQAVRQWFATHQKWLWILDNADDVTLVYEVMPPESPGHLLLTSRAQALGALAQQIEVETMGMAEATLLLLRRARLLAQDAFLDQVSEAHLAVAEAIVMEMDFLPLAIDQAGAYVEEVGCDLASYLELYRTYRKELLLRRGSVPIAHPEPVATTWFLSFQCIEQANPAAAELLRLCAFLEPDAIPEELIIEGSVHLSPILQNAAKDALQLNKAIEALRRFSLIQRNPDTHMLRIHRLVQAVIKDDLTTEEQQRWSERVVQAVNLAFPKHIEMTTWPLCRRYLPQAQICCTILIPDYTLTFEEAGDLLSRTAAYVQVYALYEQAEPLYQRALHIQEQVLGPLHPKIAELLANLAHLYAEQAKYQQAEPLYQRALHIQEQALGTMHPDVASSLNGLALLYRFLEKDLQAEQFYQRALHIREQSLGPNHPDVASSLHGLATLYHKQGNLIGAESLYQRALHIQEQAPGPDHPDIVPSLNGLALLHYRKGEYEQAELLYRRALRILEQTLGPGHLDMARPLNNLALLYVDQERYEQAEPLYQQALSIWERAWGPEHPDVAFPLTNLAGLYAKQRKYEQAERLYQRALHILEQASKPSSSAIALAFPLTNLAELYSEQGKYEQARPLYQRALDIREQARGAMHPDVATTLHGLANLYRQLREYTCAEQLYERTLSIREHVLGSSHPDTAKTLHDFAVLQEAQGNNPEAVSLYCRALLIQEQFFGLQHAKTNETRERLLALLHTISEDDGSVYRTFPVKG